ncbi:Reverse transcriptase from transposon X-element protein [Ceratobasidium sp. AG-Ba]|nr:Reverse transcriptase from transposon X-element protein [Ceratobasidium sp. AG-Ba]
MPTNPTAAKRMVRKRLLQRWKEEVKDTTWKERLQNLDPSYPSLKFFEAAKKLPRRDFAVLTQLRLEHFPVAAYLYRFKRTESPTCPNCGLQDQTVFHALMTCPAHKAERMLRSQELGEASWSFRALLEPGKATRHLMRYLERINLL